MSLHSEAVNAFHAVETLMSRYPSMPLALKRGLASLLASA